jgi:hypothetical protein
MNVRENVLNVIMNVHDNVCRHFLKQKAGQLGEEGGVSAYRHAEKDKCRYAYRHFLNVHIVLLRTFMETF